MFLFAFSILEDIYHHEINLGQKANLI